MRILIVSLIVHLGYSQHLLPKTNRGQDVQTVPDNIRTAFIRLQSTIDSLRARVEELETSEKKLKSLLWKSANDGKVRLVNGGNTFGRLEVKLSSSWGTVCDDEFSAVDATVVCKQLGFRYGIARSSAFYGEGSLPIVMDDVRCQGDENNIGECAYITDDNCSHSEDVGIDCFI